MTEFSLEKFDQAIQRITKQGYYRGPQGRIYSPNRFAMLREDAEAFGIDMSDPQWDILVQSEWVSWMRFERYLAEMGWRHE